MTSFDTAGSKQFIDSIVARVTQELNKRETVKQLDEGVYGGPVRVGRNGQILSALQGGPEYGFAQRTITEFGQKLGFVIPMGVSRRFRQGTGFQLHACIPPDVGEDPDVRASFDIQLAPVGTADDGDWTTIFTDLASNADLYHIKGGDRTFSDTTIPTLKTEFDFYDPLDIDVPAHVATQVVSVRAGWAMRCVLLKYDEEDAEDAFGTLADLVFKCILDPIE
jgi:hypothetical protein